MSELSPVLRIMEAFLRTGAAVPDDAIVQFQRVVIDVLGSDSARDRAHDRAYIAGMKFGWNCAVANDQAAFDRALAARGYGSATTISKEPT